MRVRAATSAEQLAAFLGSRFRRGGGFNLGTPLEAGTYQVKLTVNGKDYTAPRLSSKTVRKSCRIV